jgi:hypothetical protein
VLPPTAVPDVVKAASLFNVSSDDNGRTHHCRFGFATLISPEHHGHRRTESKVGSEDRSREVPSKVHVENANP